MNVLNSNYKGTGEFLLYKLTEHIFSIIFSIIVIIGAIIAIKISKKAISKAFEKINKKDTQTFKIAQKSSKILIILIAIFLILAKFKIPIAALLAIVSSCMLAFGLSLKDFFSNIAKSIQVFLMRPFDTGDLIEIDSKKGYVKKIDYMHTHIENEEHGLIMVPNAIIADKSIINYSKGTINKKTINNNTNKIQAENIDDKNIKLN